MLERVVTGQKTKEEERSKRGVFAKEKLDEIDSRAEHSPRKSLSPFWQQSQVSRQVSLSSEMNLNTRNRAICLKCQCFRLLFSRGPLRNSAGTRSIPSVLLLFLQSLQSNDGIVPSYRFFKFRIDCHPVIRRCRQIVWGRRCSLTSQISGSKTTGGKIM